MNSFFHLRAYGANGTTKDWICEVYCNKLIIRWGKTGRVSQSKEKPSHNPLIEAERLVRKKERKGYWEVRRGLPAQPDAPTEPTDVSKPKTQPETKKKADPVLKQFYAANTTAWSF